MDAIVFTCTYFLDNSTGADADTSVVMIIQIYMFINETVFHSEKVNLIQFVLFYFSVLDFSIGVCYVTGVPADQLILNTHVYKLCC